MKNRILVPLAAVLACAILVLTGCPGPGPDPAGDNPGPTTYSVTFDSQGGGVVPTAIVQSGESPSEPVDLENGDLVFSGWYTETAFTTRWNFDDPVTKAMTLYAKWNAADTLSFTAISDGAAWEVTKGSGTLDADLYIPTYYKGIPVKSIADWSFNGYSGLNGVILPSGLTRVGYCAFCDCSLTSVKLPPSIEVLDSFAFNCSQIREINIPAGLSAISSFALSGCRQMARITIDEENAYFAVVDGVLFSKDRTVLHTYPAGKPGTEYSIPSGVKEIGIGAFEASSLITVVLPEGLISIGSHAFNACVDLHTVSIPASVTTLDWRAFSLCFRSTPSTIFIPSTVSRIEGYAFWNCSNLSIRCQADEKPALWDSNWNPDGRPVTWSSPN